jgi:sugar/nucleoside kinase (ribokinase family)
VIVPKRPQAIVLGDINRDLLVHIRSFPKPSRDNPAERATWELGGSAFNAAAALVKLQIPTGVISRVGKDGEGRAILREMSKMGIHTGAVQKDPERPTGICIIPITADGERTLIGVRGANQALEPEGVTAAVQDCRHLHVSGYALIEPKTRQAAREALRAAREQGATTSIDFTWHAAIAAPEAIREALTDVTAALPSAPELRIAMGIRKLSLAAEEAVRLGAEQVAATLGAGGCRVFAAGHSYRIPPFETRVVNTCGAGDAFNAGYIYGLLAGAKPWVCAILGNAAGAATVTSELPYLALDRAGMMEILKAGEGKTRKKIIKEGIREAVELLAKRSPRKRRPKR